MRGVGTRTAPIGVHVGGRRLVAAQVGWSGGRARLIAVARVTRATRDKGPPPSSDFARLAEAMERQSFQGRRVVLVAPAEREMVSVLELPPRGSGAPLEQIAAAEFARERRLEPGTFEMAWWELPEAARGAASGMRAMAIGLEHREAEALLEGAVSAGLDPISIDARAPALSRAVSRVADASDAINCVVDVGWGGAGISLMLGSTVVYHRTIAGAGVDGWQSDFRTQLGIDEEAADVLTDVAGSDQPAPSSLDPGMVSRARAIMGPRLASLARDVSASLSYGAHLYPGRAAGKVLLVGEGARQAQVARAIGEATGLPAAALTPVQFVEPAGPVARGADDAAATLAVALSLWEEPGA